MSQQKEQTVSIRMQFPSELYGLIEQIATRRGIHALGVIKEFMRLGLLIDLVDQDEDSEFLIRENGDETRLTLFEVNKGDPYEPVTPE